MGTVFWGQPPPPHVVSWDTARLSRTVPFPFLTIRLGVRVLDPPGPHPAVWKVAVVRAVMRSVTVKIK